MIIIHLYGRYKKKFGAELKLHVDNFAAAVRLLEANFKGQFAKLIEKDSFYICRGKHVGQDHMNINDPEMLKLVVGEGEHFHLIPAAVGGASSMARKKGLGSIILGALVLGVSFFFGYAPGIYAGLSMILGGVSLLLTPDIKGENEDKNTSYSFNGPLNINAQGATKPIVYGRVRAGSVVASGAISSVNAGNNK